MPAPASHDEHMEILASCFLSGGGCFGHSADAEALSALLVEAGIWAVVENGNEEHRVFMPEYNEYWWPPFDGDFTLSAGMPCFVPDWPTFLMRGEDAWPCVE